MNILALRSLFPIAASVQTCPIKFSLESETSCPLHYKKILKLHLFEIDQIFIKLYI